MALSYLALGDSYTIGEAVAVAGRWPHQLAAALRAQGVDLADPQTIATTGWTTDELDAGIDAAAPQGPFDVVSLLIGVNNQYRSRPLDEYRQQFAALLERAIGFAGGDAGRVLVLSFPDWGATPFGAGSGRDLARIEIETDEFNAAAEVISTHRGVAFVDITDISRAHGGDPAMIADDGLHPSAAMYALWAARALPVAAQLLQHTD
ncbi:TPA: SGNH/GDSL hydrolase family protein [Stenotrophomonas maltophilia]|nr:SGNH/GDSL hydrolase family protein [Stenotrophomonas maltophilia]HDS1026539.1 SGNH/GDSL hydrolase family protein [Stenotrophomonas maltophilia]HDS1030411.1 SGNH/GDSL hydrolase family protein [Stenotrophomonas maltophilia]HDS1035302.1 SGNH/GDSL hydrolase family protein [Stenotrophomonas maltophilia]